MAMASLKCRVEGLERRKLASRPSHSTQFDEDALAIYNAMPYIDARMAPSYDEVEPTAIYRRGHELRNKLYGPIIPAALDQYIITIHPGERGVLACVWSGAE